MTQVRKSAAIAWPKKLPETKHWYRASITLDDAGSLALVRYLDIHRGLCSGLLWDLSKGAVVPGDHIELHPDGKRAVRRSATASEVVELGSGRVLAKLPDRLDVSLGPDAAFAVERCRADSPPKTAARPTTRVHAIEDGRPSALATGSVLEAFVAGGRLATVSERGGVTLWDLATRKAVGKLPGLAKPASIRVNPSGNRIALSARDGQYAVYDVDSPRPVAKGKSTTIFNGDASFDGTRYVGTNMLLDVTAGPARARSDEDEDGWLKGPRHHNGREETTVVAYPHVAVLTQRELLENPVVELWDVAAERQSASTAVKPLAAALAFAAKKLVVAHLPSDDEDWPALTILTVGGVEAAIGPSHGTTASRKKSPAKRPATKKGATQRQ